MRAAVVAVLRDLPDGPDGEPERVQAFFAVADALAKANPRPVELIAVIRESAEAVIKAAGCEHPFPGQVREVP